ncbi:MAG TPA: hypothetical protein VI874_01430, partial [Candidatus Norongarragalinales archaeon]|nr:hypothetical protein [Candidatus Norongarragalinales archaeon]
MVTPALFRERLQDLKRLELDLTPKYEALSGLYEQYEAVLEAQGLRDGSDTFGIFQERKRQKGYKPPVVKKIWLDGFFDFTEVQLAYVRELSDLAQEITITLTLDPDPARIALFENVEETKKKLLALGFDMEALPRRSKVSTGIFDHLERNLFSEKKILKRPNAESAVAVFEAVGMEGEIEMIARSILKLHRTEGHRFSDFAVLLRHIGDYESVIRSVFRRYQIPVEIHERERLEFAPFIRTVVRLLSIFQHGWRRSDVIEFLKSSYVRRLGKESKTYEWVGELEHRAVMKGVLADAKRWLEPWGDQEDAKCFDKEKTEKLRCLAELEETLRSAKSVVDINAL